MTIKKKARPAGWVKFPKKPKDTSAIFTAALRVRSKRNAQEFLHGYARLLLARRQKEGKADSPEECLSIAAGNIGYLAGYCNPPDRNRIHQLFDAPHPVFGVSYPTANKAFETGKSKGNSQP